jgi:hypothetical protein
MARANVQDFINDVNAVPGFDAVLNSDGSVAISRNGIVVRPRVLWNVMWGTVAVGWQVRARKMARQITLRPAVGANLATIPRTA